MHPQVIGIFFLETDKGATVTVSAKRYCAMLTTWTNIGVKFANDQYFAKSQRIREYQVDKHQIFFVNYKANFDSLKI